MSQSVIKWQERADFGAFMNVLSMISVGFFSVQVIEERAFGAGVEEAWLELDILNPFLLLFLPFFVFALLTLAYKKRVSTKWNKMFFIGNLLITGFTLFQLF